MRLALGRGQGDHRGVHWCVLDSAACLGEQYRTRQREQDEARRINRLATYNGEIGRGIVHTPEWDVEMKREQAWFNDR